LIRAATSRDTDASARAAAAGALGGIATPEACAALATLLRDDDTFVSVAAAAGLRRAGDRGQREIAQAASDPDATVRLRAAEAAGGMSSPTIARQLIADADPGVRTKATTAVADILSESLRSSKTVDAAALSGLAGRLADQDATVAAEASAGLARLGDTAIPALMAALGGSDTAAYHAVRALVVIGKPTVPALMKMLGGSGNVRRWSAVALGEIGAADAVGPLENLARASDPDTSYVAQMALSKLSGNN